MLRLVFIILFTHGYAHAQKTVGISQDYYHYKKGAGSLVPMFFYQGLQDAYLMARYNYEAENTFAAFAGKTWRHKNLRFTPAAGVLAGASSGLSALVHASWEGRYFFASTEPQYCHFFSGARSYGYNWAEAGVQPFENFFTGMVLQSTKERGVRKWLHEPGLLVGCNIGNVELPFYFFYPKGAAPYLMAGLHWQWQQKKLR